MSVVAGRHFNGDQAVLRPLSAIPDQSFVSATIGCRTVACGLTTPIGTQSPFGYLP